MSQLYPDLNLTVFPDGGIDTFVNYLNIVSTDGPLIHQYMEAMEAGNQVLANQILAQIPAATQKIITAQGLNKLSQAILAVERFYKTDVQPYIEQKQQELAQSVTQFAYLGDWKSNTNYSPHNMVTYSVNGVSLLFLATRAVPAGIPPTSTSYWRPLTLQGPQGPAGEGFSYAGKWDSGTPYEKDSVVTYNNALWQALTSNTNQTPRVGSDDWRLIMQIGTNIYPIQDQQPTGQEQGDLWFNTDSTPTNYYWLDTLTNPAGPDQVANGYQAYNGNGELINGKGVTADDISIALANLWEESY